LVPSETTANTAQTETGATGSGSAKVPTVPPPAKPLNGVNPTTAAVHPSAGAKPAVRDDDIPTLR
jgi:hypothetical protein